MQAYSGYSLEFIPIALLLYLLYSHSIVVLCPLNLLLLFKSHEQSMQMVPSPFTFPSC